MLSSCSGEPAKPAQIEQEPKQPSYGLDQPALGLPEPEPRSQAFRRGAALGVFAGSHDDEQTKPVYSQLLDDLVSLGISDLELVVAWVQTDARALEMTPDPVHTVDDDILRWLMGEAKRRHMRVLLSPILQVDHAERGGRSALAPADWDRWWWSYRRFSVHYARIAEAHGASLFSVGTELTSSEQQGERWRELITLVRKVYDGQLTYTAHLGQFERVSFWDAVDVVSIGGHHAYKANGSSDAELLKSYRALEAKLRAWADAHKRPYLLTAASHTAERHAPDSKVQARRTQAALSELRRMRSLYQSFRGARRLDGFYSASWLERGPVAGARLRRTPNAEILRHWFKRTGSSSTTAAPAKTAVPAAATAQP